MHKSNINRNNNQVLFDNINKTKLSACLDNYKAFKMKNFRQ